MADRNEDDRPVHVIHHVPTGATTYVPITDAEWDEIEERGAATLRQQEQDQEQEAVLKKAVADHPDPVVQALARKAGML